MRRTWPMALGAAALGSLMLFAAGGKFLWDAAQREREFGAWESAKPMSLPVDLSRPGRYEAPFQQTCATSHGEAGLLRVPADVLKTQTPRQLLAGLNATLRIRPAGGTNLVDTSSAEIAWGEETIDDAIPIFPIQLFAKGDYTAEIEVLEGAPALAGVPQQLEARYLLCGSEIMPAYVSRLAGVCLTTIGAGLGLLAVILLARRRKAPAQR